MSLNLLDLPTEILLEISLLSDNTTNLRLTSKVIQEICEINKYWKELTEKKYHKIYEKYKDVVSDFSLSWKNVCMSACIRKTFYLSDFDFHEGRSYKRYIQKEIRLIHKYDMLYFVNNYIDSGFPFMDMCKFEYNHKPLPKLLKEVLMLSEACGYIQELDLFAFCIGKFVVLAQVGKTFTKTRISMETFVDVFYKFKFFDKFVILNESRPRIFLEKMFKINPPPSYSKCVDSYLDFLGKQNAESLLESFRWEKIRPNLEDFLKNRFSDIAKTHDNDQLEKVLISLKDTYIQTQAISYALRKGLNFVRFEKYRFTKHENGITESIEYVGYFPNDAACIGIKKNKKHEWNNKGEYVRTLCEEKFSFSKDLKD